MSLITKLLQLATLSAAIVSSARCQVVNLQPVLPECGSQPCSDLVVGAGVATGAGLTVRLTLGSAQVQAPIEHLFDLVGTTPTITTPTTLYSLFRTSNGYYYVGRLVDGAVSPQLYLTRLWDPVDPCASKKLCDTEQIYVNFYNTGDSQIDVVSSNGAAGTILDWESGHSNFGLPLTQFPPSPNTQVSMAAPSKLVDTLSGSAPLSAYINAASLGLISPLVQSAILETEADNRSSSDFTVRAQMISGGQAPYPCNTGLYQQNSLGDTQTYNTQYTLASLYTACNFNIDESRLPGNNYTVLPGAPRSPTGYQTGGFGAIYFQWDRPLFQGFKGGDACSIYQYTVAGLSSSGVALQTASVATYLTNAKTAALTITPASSNIVSWVVYAQNNCGQTSTPAQVNISPPPPRRRVQQQQATLSVGGGNLVDSTGKIVALRGVNLGGWLEQESWMDGEQTPDPNSQVNLKTDIACPNNPDASSSSYLCINDRFALERLETRFGTLQGDSLISAWEQNFITDTDFAHIAAAGFNVVRIPFSWRNLQHEDGSWILNAQGDIDFSLLDGAVNEAAQYGLYVIFDLHVWQGQRQNYGNIVSSATNSDLLHAAAIWQAMAAYYAGNSTVAGFDLLNAVPQSSSQVWRVLYNAVRNEDPDRILFVQRGQYTSLSTDIDPSSNQVYSNLVYEPSGSNFDSSGLVVAQNDFSSAMSGFGIPTPFESSNEMWPVFVGAFKEEAQTASWITQQMDSYGWSWAQWSWKAVNDGGWALYNIPSSPSTSSVTGNSPYVDLANDSLATILASWTTGIANKASVNNPLYNAYSQGATNSNPVGAVPSGYTFCSNDGATCSFSGAASVAYGANGNFFYQNATGSIPCNVTQFGDPLYGTVKACYYQLSVVAPGTYRVVSHTGMFLTTNSNGAVILTQSTTDPNSQWVVSSSFGNQINFSNSAGQSLAGLSGTEQIPFGTTASSVVSALTTWQVSPLGSGSYSLVNEATALALDSGVSVAAGGLAAESPLINSPEQTWVLSPVTTNPAGFTLCAGEGQLCLPPGPATVSYGANGLFSYEYYSDTGTGFVCGVSSFGGVDPDYGIVKACYYTPEGPHTGGISKQAPPGYALCSVGDPGFCSFSGTKTVAYGGLHAASNFADFNQITPSLSSGTFTNGVFCSASTFNTSPPSGPESACFVPVVPLTLPGAGALCAAAGQRCAFSGYAAVSYVSSAGAVLYQAVFYDGAPCAPVTFGSQSQGQPVLGDACYFQSTAAQSTQVPLTDTFNIISPDATGKTPGLYLTTTSAGVLSLTTNASDPNAEWTLPSSGLGTDQNTFFNKGASLWLSAGTPPEGQVGGAQGAAIGSPNVLTYPDTTNVWLDPIPPLPSSSLCTGDTLVTLINQTTGLALDSGSGSPLQTTYGLQTINGVLNVYGPKATQLWDIAPTGVGCNSVQQPPVPEQIQGPATVIIGSGSAGVSWLPDNSNLPTTVNLIPISTQKLNVVSTTVTPGVHSATFTNVTNGVQYFVLMYHTSADGKVHGSTFMPEPSFIPSVSGLKTPPAPVSFCGASSCADGASSIMAFQAPSSTSGISSYTLIVRDPNAANAVVLTASTTYPNGSFTLPASVSFPVGKTYMVSQQASSTTAACSPTTGPTTANQQCSVESPATSITMIAGMQTSPLSGDVGAMTKSMLSMDNLAEYPGVTVHSGLSASTDPATMTTNFYGNNDGIQFLNPDYYLPTYQQVLLDVDGPGVITRLSILGNNDTAQTISYFLDGSTVPAIIGVVNDWLLGNPVEDGNGKTIAGPGPFAWQAVALLPGNCCSNGGSNNNLPIPFAKHAKVVLSYNSSYLPYYSTGGKIGYDYNLDYTILDPSTPVTTFSASGYANDSTTIQTAAKGLSPVAWQGSALPMGSGAWTDRLSSTLTSTTLSPNQSVSIQLPQGAHAIRFLQASLGSPNQTTLRGVLLNLTFDGESTIANVPIGDFFGSGLGLNVGTTQSQSVTSAGLLSSRWTMPYQSTATLSVTNTTSSSVSISLNADIGAWIWDAKSMHFHAYYRTNGPFGNAPFNCLFPGNPDDPGYQGLCQTMRFLDVIGSGVYVGDNETVTQTYSVANPYNNWWGEGDEMFYVDKAVFPLRGTGTEDYYGYALGHTILFQSPWDSQVVATSPFPAYVGTTVLNKTRLLDTVPFANHLRFDFEVHAWNPAATQTFDHVAYFYALPGAQLVPDGVVSGSTYTLQSKVAGWNMEVVGGNVLTDVLRNDPSQRFIVKSAPSGSYTLMNIGTSNYLTLPARSGSAGASLQVAPATNDCSQQWTITSASGSNDYSVLTSVCSSQVVDLRNASVIPGTVVQQYPANGSDAQSWRLNLSPDVDAAPASATPPTFTSVSYVPEGTYVITNLQSGLAMDVVNAASAPGTAVQQFAVNGGPAQRWVLSLQPDGVSYRFTNAASQDVLDNGGASSAGSGVVEYPWSNGANQWWTLTSLGNGSFEITNAANKLAVGVSEDSTSTAPLTQQLPGSSVSQGWLFIPAVSSVATAAAPVPAGTSTVPAPGPAPYLPCATEGQVCSFNGPAIVSFGDSFGVAGAGAAGNQGFYSQAAVNSLFCSDGTFGGDPNPGVPKSCWYQLLPSGPQDGVYQVVSAKSHLSLDVVNGSSASGTLVQQYTADGTGAQQWLIQNRNNGYYSIIDMSSGLALDNAGSTASGSQLEQATWVAAADQLWRITANPDGSYTFANSATGYTMTVGSSVTAGGAVSQGVPAAGASQNWYLEPTGSLSPVETGIYTLFNRNSLLALDVVNHSSVSGSFVAQYTAHGGSNQEWAISKLPNGDYSVINIHSGLALSSNGATSGPPVLVTTWSNSNTQWWSFFPNTDGSFRVGNAATGLVMGVFGSKTGSGALTDQWTGDGAPDQGWTLQEAPQQLADGTYTISNANSGLLMDVDNGSTASGAAVQQYASDGTAAQQWIVAVQPGGYYSITNVKSGLQLSTGGLTTVLAGLTQDNKATSATDWWQINANTDGSFVITNLGDSFTIGVQSDSTSTAPLLQQVNGTGGSQTWYFTPVP